MNSTYRFLTWIALLFLTGVILVGCDSMENLMPGQASSEATALPVKPILTDDGTITSKGRLVPKKSVDLAFSTAGQVEEILVEEGDQVKKGQVIARLTGRKQFEAAIALAELELFNAQQARQLMDDNLDEDRNAALLALNTARQALDDAERKLGGLGGTADQTDIDLAYTQLLFAEDELEKAFDRLEEWGIQYK